MNSKQLVSEIRASVNSTWLIQDMVRDMTREERRTLATILALHIE